MYFFVQIQSAYGGLDICSASWTHPEGPPLFYTFHMAVYTFQGAQCCHPPLSLLALHANGYEWKGNGKGGSKWT